MSKLLKKQMRFWVRLFWTTVFFAVITLAVLLQIGRTVFPVVDEYRLSIESQLSGQLGVELSIGEIEAVWQGLRPRVSLNEVSILNDLGEPVFEIGQIDIELSILKTLRDQRLSFRQLAFRNLEATLNQKPSGAWRIHGLPESTSMSSSKSEEFTIDDPLDIFLFGRRVELIDTSLDFLFFTGLQSTLVIPKISLENDAKFHRLSASFAVDGGKQELNFLLEGMGDPRDEEEFEASGFLTLSDFPLEKVLAAIGVEHDILLPQDFAEEAIRWHEDGSVDLNLWIDRKADKGFTWQGDVSVEGVPFLPREGMVWPQTLSSDLSGAWQKDGGWMLSLSELNLLWSNFSAPELNLKAFGGLGKPVRLAVESIDAKDWHEVAQKAGFVSGRLKEVFDDLQPEGQLHNIWMDILDKESGYFALTADVVNGVVSPWEGVPAVAQVNGYLEASAFEGHISLNSQEGFSLGFPKIYLHTLNFNEAKGDVRWQVDLESRQVGISSGLLEVSNDHVSASGHFDLDIPFESSPGVEPEMTLVIGVERGVASLHKMLVPYTVPQQLNDWLGRSIKDGVLTNAGFIYHGSLESDNQLSRVLQFSADVHQAKLKFDPKWPELTEASGVMLLDDEDFRATNLRGRMHGTQISKGEVSLVNVLSDSSVDNNQKPSYEQAISIKASVAGDSGDALNLLKQTPIAHILGEELGSWKMKGHVEGQIALIVPLSDDSEASEQDIQLQVVDNQLQVPSLGLTIQNITGPLRYSHVGGVASSGLMGELWDQSIEAKISTKQKGIDSSINVDFAGMMDVNRLEQWSQRPELKFAKGVTSIKAQLTVPLIDDKSPIHLEALSALEGIKISLPAPFGKTEEELSTLGMDLNVYQSGNKQKHKYLFSFNGLAEAIVINENDHVKGISIALNDAAKSIVPGSMTILGTLQKGDIGLWSDAVVQYDEYVQAQEQAVRQVEDSGDEGALILDMNIHVSELQLDTLSIENVNIMGSESRDAYIFRFDSEHLAGLCTIFDDERPMKVELDRFYLEQSEEAIAKQEAKVEEDELIGEEVDGLINVDVNTLPAMDFSVKEFKSGITNYGQWSYKLRPISGGVIAYDLYAEVLGLTVQGKYGDGAELIWLQSGDKNETFFSGLVTAGDLGPVMEKWDMERAITSDHAKFFTDVQWYGAPDEIELERLFGIIDIEFEHGRFIRGETGGGNPLVKLVGLLNFDTLVRRFRLDFSDLHPEGMSYDRVQGSFQFKRGVVVTQSPMLVAMPASDIQFVGDIYVLTEKVDAQLIVTLPLAGLSTTIAAALTGGVPLAVGVFVVGKIFKDQVDLASSLRYRVVGSWDDPEMELEKVFENKVEE